MVVRGPKKSWVRFAEAIVPWREVPIMVARDMLAHVHDLQDLGPDEEDQALPFEEST
jgi:hypothetical protein